MPKRRPPHVLMEYSRKREAIWYHRIGAGPRTRLWHTFGSKDFLAEVAAAEAGTPLPKPRTQQHGRDTFAWAIGLYRRSSAWTALSEATRKQRGNILDRIVKSPAAAQPFSATKRKGIQAGVDARASTPAAARHFLQTMRGLFAWAVDGELVSTNPTTGVLSKAAATDGHLSWTEDDIEAFETRWPRGTRERVAFDILLYTGLRRGDAVQLGRQHVKAGIIRLNTEKTGTRVTIKMDADLVATLEAGPCGDLTFIAGERGLPRVKASFGEFFRHACREAGVKGKSAHGLRKSAAERAAENGATEKQLEAMFGWSGGRMAAHYTKSANRDRLGIEAGDTLARRKS